jgi:alginate O-acetyltransferase complex protein AlgI
MLFSSAVFLFLFLPLALLFYYIAPKNFKNGVLLLFSFIFYTWGEQKVVFVMLAITLLNYICALLIEKGNRKLWLSVSIIGSLASLGFFKYFNFTFDNLNNILAVFDVKVFALQHLPQIRLPMGISFYVFQTMSYSIDVYRKEIKANKNFVEFATYVTMFPQLVAGPIVRYIDIQTQLRNKKISLEHFSSGVQRFIIGLSKKMLIANPCAAIADDVFKADMIADLPMGIAWLGIIAYSFQIYFDFSGYSDMAIGLGRMFGFSFLENFNYPYISKSIREFWRRWHISLSTWFRDYLYISLGGSRTTPLKIYFNLFIVFFVTGLWHGASWNFVVWGLFHGLFIILERIGLEKLLEKSPIILQRTYTLLIVIIAWVFFRAEDLSMALTYLKRMFSFSDGSDAVGSYIAFYHFNNESVITLVAAFIFSFPTYLWTTKKLEKWNINFSQIIKLVVLALLLIICGAYIAADTYNPFIYFRF